MADGTELMKEYSTQMNNLFISLLDSFKILPYKDNNHWCQIKEFTILIEKIKRTELMKTHDKLIGTKFKSIIVMFENLPIRKDYYWENLN